MSQINELLAGVKVEWKTLGDIAEIGTGNSNRQDESENGKYNFYVRSKNILKSDTFQFDETAIIIPGEGGIGDIFHYVEGKYALHQRAYRVHITEQNINTKYVFYVMSNSFKNYILSKSVGTTAVSIRKPMLLKYSLPIPPIYIQQKIVEILDKFTQMCNELTAELTLRRKQYNYFRDLLLSEDYLNKMTESLGGAYQKVERRALGEIAQYSKTRISADQLTEQNYVGVDNLLQDRQGKTLSNHAPAEGNFTEFRENDILIGNIRPYLKKIWLSNLIGGTNGDVLVVRLNDEMITSEYLYQLLADDKFFHYNIQHSKGARMPRGSKEAIMNYEIPIPSLTIQSHIVAILDQFDTLTNSITQGLPKEIELRQKQYEYYREKLLTFEKE